MAQALVWNDNTFPHKEEFKGKIIEIGPKQSLKMDYEEAMEFKSQFTPVITDGEKIPLQEFKKIIRVEVLGDAKANVPLVCHATGKTAANEEELKAMLAASADMLADPDAAKKADEVALLKAQVIDQGQKIDQLIALLSQQQQPKGPGRPKKQA